MEFSSFTKRVYPFAFAVMQVFPSLQAYEVIAPIDIAESEASPSIESIKSDQSISQSLTYKHGLQIQDIYGDESRMAIPLRGFGDNASTNTLIIVNGQPLRRADAALPSLLGIEHGSIESIDVKSQSGGVLYGDQAVGGVVEITTNPFKKNRTALEVSQGTAHTTMLHPFISRHNNRLPNFYLGGLYQESDHDLPDNFERLRTVNSGVQGYLKSSMLSLEHSFRDQKLFFPGPFDKRGNRLNLQPDGQKDFNEQIVNSFDQKAEIPLSDAWGLSLQSVFNRMTGEGRLTNTFDEKSDGLFVKTEAEGEFTLGDVTLLPLVGMDYNESEYQFITTGYRSTVSQRTHSFYTQLQVPLSTQTMLTTGYRYSEASSRLRYASLFNSDDSVHIKSIGLTHEFTAQLHGYFRYGENFRFAKPEENAFTLNQRPLKPQIGYSLESGLSYDTSNTHFAFSLYQLNIENEIFFIPKNQTDLFAANRNIKKTSRKGFSLAGSLKPLKKLTTGLTYHYVAPKIKSREHSGKTIPFVSRHSVSLSNNYELTPRFDIYSYLGFYSERYAAGDYENTVSTVPAYFVADAGVRYHWKRLKVTLDLNNFLDKRYYTNVVSTQATDDEHTYYYPAATRAYHMTVAYDF